MTTTRKKKKKKGNKTKWNNIREVWKAERTSELTSKLLLDFWCAFSCNCKYPPLKKQKIHKSNTSMYHLRRASEIWKQFIEAIVDVTNTYRFSTFFLLLLYLSFNTFQQQISHWRQHSEDTKWCIPRTADDGKSGDK